MRQLNKAVNARGSLRAEALCAYGGTLAYFTSAGEVAAAKEKSSLAVIQDSLFFFLRVAKKPMNKKRDGQKEEPDEATCLEVLASIESQLMQSELN